MKITTEMYEALKIPLPAEAVKPHPTKTYLSSIKAIFVTERLNDVFGCGSWQIKAEKIADGEKGMVVVKVILTIPEYDVYYESFGGNDNGGEGSKNFDLGDAYKGATTDGITKIGSYLGIGIDVFKGLKNTPAAPKEVKRNPDEEIKEQLKIAISEIKKSTTLDEVKKCWLKWKAFQENALFATEKDIIKIKLTPKE